MYCRLHTASRLTSRRALHAAAAGRAGPPPHLSRSGSVAGGTFSGCVVSAAGCGSGSAAARSPVMALHSDVAESSRCDTCGAGPRHHLTGVPSPVLAQGDKERSACATLLGRAL